MSFDNYESRKIHMRCFLYYETEVSFDRFDGNGKISLGYNHCNLNIYVCLLSGIRVYQLNNINWENIKKFKYHL